jgi:hypothetical protein
MECQYRLASYGITRQNLRMMPDADKVDMKYHLEWCEKHLMKPRNDALKPKHTPQLAEAKNFITITRPTDVFYMGGNRSNNGGNDHVRSLVAEWSQTYDSGGTDTKRCLVNGIIDSIHKSGGRFLSQVDGEESAWEAVPLDQVRSKIAHMFRNLRRMRGSRKKKSLT